MAANVAVASLGMIALRSVVERRQQIGMPRAIGYRRGFVAMSFMLESGFVAMAGIGSGVVGATILSWNLMGSDYFQGNRDVEFFVPRGRGAAVLGPRVWVRAGDVLVAEPARFRCADCRGAAL